MYITVCTLNNQLFIFNLNIYNSMIKLTQIIDEINKPLSMKMVNNNTNISEGLKYHIEREIPLCENVYRTYSPAYFDLINEVRKLYFDNLIELSDEDAELIESNLGEKAIFNNEEVYLDAPIEDFDDFNEEGLNEGTVQEIKHRGRNVKLNRPFRTPGGPKKYAVYVKSKSGKIKKVTFGDPGLRVRGRSAARRKSFAARHKCSQKKDRTTAGYWSCRSHRIKSLGNKGKGKYW